MSRVGNSFFRAYVMFHKEESDGYDDMAQGHGRCDTHTPGEVVMVETLHDRPQAPAQTDVDLPEPDGGADAPARRADHARSRRLLGRARQQPHAQHRQRLQRIAQPDGQPQQVVQEPQAQHVHRGVGHEVVLQPGHGQGHGESYEHRREQANRKDREKERKSSSQAHPLLVQYPLPGFLSYSYLQVHLQHRRRHYVRIYFLQLPLQCFDELQLPLLCRLFYPLSPPGPRLVYCGQHLHHHQEAHQAEQDYDSVVDHGAGEGSKSLVVSLRFRSSWSDCLCFISGPRLTRWLCFDMIEKYKLRLSFLTYSIKLGITSPLPS